MGRETYGRGAEAGMRDIQTVRKTSNIVPLLVRTDNTLSGRIQGTEANVIDLPTPSMKAAFHRSISRNPRKSKLCLMDIKGAASGVFSRSAA